MLTIIVLGSAAGGGLPQWNCNCPTCRDAWSRPEAWNGQTGLAVSADEGRHWFLINASPDLRQQILSTPALHPAPDRLRHTPIAGVVLTNGEVDAVAGLLSLREGARFAVIAHPAVLDILGSNPIFDVLPRGRVPRLPLEPGQSFEPPLPDGSPSGLLVEAFPVPGKVPLYLEGAERSTSGPGGTLGLTLRARNGGAAAHVITACAKLDAPLEQRLRGADLVFFDGTLWRDDEMIALGLSQKTGRGMGHLPMTGQGGTMALLPALGVRRRVFVHINNSNPVLRPGSPERQVAESAGWVISAPGQEFRT